MEVDIPGGKAGQSVSPCRGALRYLSLLDLFLDMVFIYYLGVQII